MSRELSASGAREGKISPIMRLRCFVDGCNNEHRSRHLRPSSESLEAQRINVTFILKVMRRSPIYLCANHSCSSFIYRRSEFVFLWIFANHLFVEGRGQWSSLAFKATWTKKRLAENRADFDKENKMFLHYH